ncbi:MAG: hypothetical protein KF916_03920 [Microbacteriaceae bacterium]|nr:hypothetical protein [Microbacteriaceae bacterium]
MLDGKAWLTIITVSVALVLFALMFIGYRKHRRSNPVVFAELPSGLANPEFVISGMYLSSNRTENKLVRVSAGPLGFRGRVVFEVHKSGILIGIDGEQDFWIPVGDIAEIAHESYTIDRAVEQGGMAVIRWNEGAISSYFRLAVADDKVLSDWLEAARSVRG